MGTRRRRTWGLLAGKLLSPVDEDFEGLIGGLLNRGEDQEPLAVVGDHIRLRSTPTRDGKYGGSFEQESGDTGLEGSAVGLHVHGIVAAVELVVQFFAVATPSGYLPSRYGDLPFAARLRRV